MPFVAHRDRSRRRWVPHRHDNRPFPASSQAPTLPRSARAASCSVLPGRRSPLPAHANGRQSSRCAYGTCPTDHPRNRPPAFLADILSHRFVYRWSMLLGDGAPWDCTSSPSPTSSYARGNSSGRFDTLGRWTWFVAGNGPRRPPGGSSPLRWAKVDGRQNHLRDVSKASVVLDTAILIESSSLFGWAKRDSYSWGPSRRAASSSLPRSMEPLPKSTDRSCANCPTCSLIQRWP